MQQTAKWQREERVQNTAGSDMEPTGHWLRNCLAKKQGTLRSGLRGPVPSGTGVMP
jgi:hypothetical protein